MAEKTIVTGSREKGYILYSDGTILLRGLKGVWPHMGRPFGGGLKNEDGSVSQPKHSITMLLPKTGDTADKQRRLVEREIKKVIDAGNRGQDIKEDMKCLRDGDREGKAFLKGHYVLSLSETVERAPALRGPKGEKYDREHMGEVKIDNLFSDGSTFDVLFNLWPSTKKGFRVNGGLKAIQLIEKGENISGSGGIADDEVDDAFGIAEGDAGFGDDSDEL